jgi:hypothetical protein
MYGNFRDVVLLFVRVGLLGRLSGYLDGFWWGKVSVGVVRVSQVLNEVL